MEHKVIFHIDENDRWGLLLGNADNLLRAAADTHVTVEVLANGPAVLGYALNPASADTAAAMAALHKSGVVFAACRNAMKANGLTAEAIMDFVVPVPAGVVELMERQEQGYCYIKP